MAIKLLPLTGLKSVHALCAFNALLFGVHCTPAHAAKSEEEFYRWFDDLKREDKEKTIRYAVGLCKLGEDEMLDLLAFAQDPNGLAYGAANAAGLKPAEIVDIITAVCLKISDIKLKSVSEELKKNSLPIA